MIKSIFIAVVMLLFVSSSNAQVDKAINRASEMTTYIAEKMSMNEVQAQELNSALVTKIKYQHQKINNQDLTQEEKKVVYKQAGKSFFAILSRRFSKEDITKIKQHMSDFNKVGKPS
ncbi:hypothetical protein E9993_16670 [Labilibacter sediminis]|nr:hypothetical protein E9993_16670 [Labilibacter sediminis]